MKTKYINRFTFGTAKYLVSDSRGFVGELYINYAQNLFKLKTINGKVTQNFQKEINTIAKDLLKRKHGINFAENK